MVTSQTGIEVRPLATHSEFGACVELQRETWGREFSDLVPASILKVSQRVGGVAAGAFDVDGSLVGFVFGLTGVEDGRVVHWSDMLAVRRSWRGRGISRLLKDYQRRTVRDLGADVIYWTFDPLLARNANLNINKLGAYPVEYVEDMYGTTDSVLHGGIPTDRLVVAWPTADDELAQRLDSARRSRDDRAAQTAPIVTTWSPAGSDAGPPRVRVEIPVDAESLFATDRQSALKWRHSLRDALGGALASERGYVVDGFTIDADSGRAFYLLRQNSGQRTAYSGQRDGI